jgi:PAS domain S-box-containing protein
VTLPLFEELKRYVGFGAEDAEVLRSLLPAVRPHFPSIVDEFYREILLHEATRRILSDPGQIERLKGSLREWLEEAFQGPHDAAYQKKRSQIGLRHVDVGLPQAFVFTAMSGIRRRLEEPLLSVLIGRPEKLARGLQALNKVLHLELALIAGSYHEAEKYHDVVEFAPDMIHQLDREGRILKVNLTEQEVLGYTEEQLLGRRFEELVHPEDRPSHQAHLKEVFSGKPGICELRLLTRRGQELVAEIRATAQRDVLTREIIHTRGYVRDITTRKRQEEELRREKERAEMYLEVAGVILITLDSAGRVSLINKKGCEILGLTRAEIVGQPWFETFVPERVRGAARAAFDNLVSERVPPAEYFENPVLTRSGEERIIEWHNQLMRDEAGRVLGTISSGSDVTDRRRMAQALMEQESLARMGEMAAVVAHEVRNPLAGIAGAIQVIGGNLAPADRSQPIIQEILARIDALNGFVSDMLVFARPRPPRLAQVPILSLLQDTVSLLLQDAKFERLAIRTAGPDLVVPCDSELLKTVFYNLLLNAAQALKGEGRISITVGNSAELCRVSISDSGPGIPAAILDKIFEPFFSTKHQGSGLGLPIAKRIVEAHGGRITLSSSPGAGTTATVQLPLEPDGGATR